MEEERLRLWCWVELLLLLWPLTMSPFRYTHAIVCRIPESYKANALGISAQIDLSKASSGGALLLLSSSRGEILLVKDIIRYYSHDFASCLWDMRVDSVITSHRPWEMVEFVAENTSWQKNMFSLLSDMELI